MGRAKILLPPVLALILAGFVATSVWASRPQQQTTNMLRGGIVINEALPDPKAGGSGFDTDDNGDVNKLDEFIELYNMSNAAINLEGLELWDRGTGKWYTFPNAQLKPKAYATVIVSVQAGGVWPTAQGDNFFFNAGLSDDLMSNNGDNIVLLDRNVRQYIQVKFTKNNTTTVEPTDDPVMLSKTLDANGKIEGYEGFPGDASRVGTVDHLFYEEGVSITRAISGDVRWVIHNDNDLDNNAADASPGSRAVTAVFLQEMEVASNRGGHEVWLVAVLFLGVPTVIIWLRGRLWAHSFFP